MMLSHSLSWDKLGTKLRLATQNFNGLKTDDSLDIITNIMEKCNIGIFVTQEQETWRHGKEKESESIVVNNTQIFLHGTVDQDPKSKSGSGGIAVFLSKNAKQAWIDVRKPEPILGGPSPDHAR
jgi:hypothetical protein